MPSRRKGKVRCGVERKGGGGVGNLIVHFPSCCSKPLFHSEAKGESIGLRIIIYSCANTTHFQKKGFAQAHPAPSP